MAAIGASIAAADDGVSRIGSNGASVAAMAVASAWFDTDGRAASTRPLAVVDKRAAQLLVYDTEGRLVGVTPALLGAARGDRAFPDALRKLTSAAGLPPTERSTPAGRYAAQPGRNLRGDPVVWFDYAAALAIHRLRPAPAVERRPERLASPSPDDNRITLGCVVIDPTFFDAVVWPLVGRQRGDVIILAEDEPDGIVAEL
jgi:hypothetical protein